MDISKFNEWFEPSKCRNTIHIIGCGASGSAIAELLVRMGLTKFVLYDFDIVEAHNIANQMFSNDDINKPKTEALAAIMRRINPDVEIRTEGKYENQMLEGYVFLAIDSIEVTRKIVEDNMYNLNIIAMFNTRLSLLDAQSYAARWDSYTEKESFLASMNFTDEEARANTPVSACQMELGVAPTVRLICTLTVANFINLLKKDFDRYKTIILLQDAFGCLVAGI